MTLLSIRSYTTSSAAGIGKAAMALALREARSGLIPNDLPWAPLPCWIGRVSAAEEVALPATLADYDCRNHRLALLALEQDGFMSAVAAVRQKYGSYRVGVFLGTSTSGILSTEIAYQHRDPITGRLPADFHYATTHNLDATTEFVRSVLGLAGPAMTMSTACSSSAKVFCLAERLIRLGLIDAAVVGGVDSLCGTTLYGFNSLQLVAPDICRPFDAARQGLSIGEAAGFVLLDKEDGTLRLLGYGETSDAHHMSTPHPEGDGARRAMLEALARAQLGAHEIDYINLHGTATPANDRAEGRAVAGVFGAATPCSSTKGFTGHTLGAAGITEAAIALLSLERGFIPGSPTTRDVDPETQCGIVLHGYARPLSRVMSNSFGFGGSNCALIFGRVV
ncbi:3-oxoacyl-(acyl-carrier-protein) synthase, FabV inferred for ABFAE pathway [Georgfuchsia toluolica]|uniref:3-oxoacyl-(Acyl-carrier-protein) synthase, FabV inferred for ABFAE pathway n=1 Tax=Georgfuchsia toluolica TaxID=424218 RepID=A0A916J3U4_9PROT|nr:beta-ketoacyl-[acyl-carrier-protein] synthase family protein [Georgfuchsia toluolica]CAG4883457.1 3-oxoacyl-(acyl-carrier-protein) synthase, FabV inferred for ABFAE pathway [Georgfuchsia toluolica]